MMETNGNRTTAGYAVAPEWRSPGEWLSHDTFFRVFSDDLASGNGRLNGNGKAPRVLIVDDDPAGRLLCSINLRIEGFVVLEAADGGSGLERARSESPDLVVTDVRMPVLDGFQLAEALACDSRTRQIPLIFLSAETEPANAARAYELGALAYLTKPFDPPALAALVTGALDCDTKGERPEAPHRAEAAAVSPAHR